MPLLNAIRMVKGVISVEPIVSDSTHFMARRQVAHEIYMKFMGTLREYIEQR